MSKMRFTAKPEMKEKRLAMGTQEQLTQLLKAATGRNFQRTYIVLIETGQRTADSEIALAISQILGCEVDEIFENQITKAN